ncbi:hypothetical protein GJ496_002819 [Pomphorhynchus laevis]|nr:hypothetical protein GJ496_002819 [Pomphorhynchus laevis]
MKLVCKNTDSLLLANILDDIEWTGFGVYIWTRKILVDPKSNINSLSNVQSLRIIKSIFRPDTVCYRWILIGHLYRNVQLLKIIATIQFGIGGNVSCNKCMHHPYLIRTRSAPEINSNLHYQFSGHDKVTNHLVCYKSTTGNMDHKYQNYKYTDHCQLDSSVKSQDYKNNDKYKQKNSSASKLSKRKKSLLKYFSKRLNMFCSESNRNQV